MMGNELIQISAFQDDSVDGRPRSLAQLKISAQNAVEFQHDHPDRVRSFNFWS